MSSFFSKKIEDITDGNELLAVLVKRKYWNRIPENILQQIFDNSQGDIEKVKRFIFVSELHGSVKNNFISIAKDEVDIKTIIALFAVTLERLAAHFAQKMDSFPKDSTEEKMAVGTAEMAYMSSILCNPFILPSYVGLASFHMFFDDKEQAIKVLNDYDIVEKKLLDSNDDSLTSYDKAIKDNIPETRKMINIIKNELKIQI